MSTRLRRTHCRYGHAYTPENSYLRRDAVGVEHRQCRTCKREQQRDRRRAAAQADSIVPSARFRNRSPISPRRGFRVELQAGACDPSFWPEIVG